MKLEELFDPYSPPETNFLDRLRYWAAAIPEKIAYRFIAGDGEIKTLTFAELDQQAKAVAAMLVSKGYAGKRALMMYPSGLDFVVAFFGCHYAAVTPVPAFPPRRNRNMARIGAISDDAQASVAISVTSVIKSSEKWINESPGLQRIPWLSTESVAAEFANDWVKPKSSLDDLGLIQYTSGSTGSPKGVMLSHRNLIANCRMITRAFQTTREGSICSWLPLYHDMGLVGGILNPMYCGTEDNLMSPVAFLTRPIRWLRAISDYGSRASGGPNFAYAWCTMKINDEDCEGLDLSSWKVAFNGAEPVSAAVMERFTEKFAPYGFSPEAFYPCYGMAETTLIVTGGSDEEAPIVRPFDKYELVEHRVLRVDENHENARKLVGCGKVLEEEEVLIVHPENHTPLPDDKIGEIWINSPSCGLGYWQREQETLETFRARLKPDNGKHYVRSGDLGFMDRGELFVTGRLKDMIIVRGANRYPQDIENTVELCHPLTRSGGAAAFSVTRWDREHLVIVCEIERSPDNDQWESVIKRIRTSVALEHDLPPDAIVLVRGHSVPKTSSGKVQRHACKRNFENGEDIHVMARWCLWEESQNTNSTQRHASAEIDGEALADSNLAPEVVQAVIEQVHSALTDKTQTVEIDTNILELGLDSLARLDVAQSLERAFGGKIPEQVLQDIETVREVATAIQKYAGTKKTNGEVPESFYKLEKMPEFMRLQSLRQRIEDSGIRNPFFSVHEGRISDTTEIDGKQLISYASYNYLGLSGDPEVNLSAKNAIDNFGTSVSASRIVSGEKTIHKQLEKELSEFLGVEDVITFPGGHGCNESVIGHLMGRGDLILHDSFAHNSLIQGAMLSGAQRRPFEHNNWEDLENILRSCRGEYRRVLIIIEGLYSMDGDYPNLPKFVEIKKRYKAWLYLDEAHSIGTLGETGRGLGEVYDVQRDDIECWMGTLSKSFGSCGGFVGASRSLIEYLRYTTPGYVFAAGMPPANVGAALGSLRVLQRRPELVAKLQSNAQLFLSLAKEAGLDTGMAQGTAIIPIITGHSLKALRLSEALFDHGINAQPILYPAVPEKETRVRIFMTAAHSEKQIRDSVEILAREWERIIEENIAIV
ncbi:MAG: aminotransferase class I/II-fold pyridoxal phosphate-dependent enzyme [Mariniblastus sp.]|nr:aminotransferase class I/II-fold pyridoxal phosphate-dependent enzyme [Mariniblastus sp.]